MSASNRGRLAALLDEFFFRPDEDVGPGLELAVPSPEDVSPAIDETPSEHLAFVLGAEVYAMSLTALREIVKVPPLTEVPRAERTLLGVMNLRGEVIPVYDLALRIGLSEVPAPAAGPEASPERLGRGARVLVIRSDLGPAGVLVDAVVGVVRLRRPAIEEPPRGLGAGEGDWMVGIGREGERLFILIDLERALS